MEDFSHPKIVWARLMRLSKSDLDSFPRFCVVPKEFVVVDSLCFFTGSDLDILVQELNSEYAAYYFFNSVATLDNGGFQMRQQYIEEIPLPILKHYNGTIDCKIYDAFGFTREEIEFIGLSVKQRKQEIENAL